MKETKKRRYIVSTIMYGMILIFIQLPWVVLKGKNYSIYAAYFRIKAKGIKALSEMAASVWDGNLTIIRILIRWSGTILNMTGKITASCCSVV